MRFQISFPVVKNPVEQLTVQTWKMDVCLLFASFVISFIMDSLFGVVPLVIELMVCGFSLESQLERKDLKYKP